MKARKKKDDGRNPAVLRLASKLEMLIAQMRREMRPNQQVSMNWRAGFAGSDGGNSITSWHHGEATKAAKLVLAASDRKTELSLVLTGILNLVQLDQVDKPDSLVAEYAYLFVEDHRDLFAEVILSGGDE